MGTRALLSGAPTVEVDMRRYDELLHKEAKLESILNIAAKCRDLNTNYIWDIVGVKNQEDEQ